MKEIHGDYGPGMDRAHKMLCNGGYKTGGDVTVGKVKKIAKRAVREHESHEHGGKHTKLKLKTGGHVKGEMAAERPDRRARGGATKGKIGSVNIVIGKGGDEQEDQQKQQMAAKAGLQKGVQIGAQMAAQKMGGAGGPPPGGPMPPPGGPPPGPMAGPGGPPPPMPPRKSGGSVPHLTAGAGSALGRLEKAGKVHVRAHERRRGGKC